VAKELYDHLHDADETRNVVASAAAREAFAEAVRLLDAKFPRRGYEK
jgi:hypothetical protein